MAKRLSVWSEGIQKKIMGGGEDNYDDEVRQKKLSLAIDLFLAAH